MADYYDQDPVDIPEEEGPPGIRPVASLDHIAALLVTESPTPPLTVVIFVAPFCPHTKQHLIPTLSEMCVDPEYAQLVTFALCDITESNDVATAYDVIASPTIAIHYGETKLYQYHGADPAALRQVIARCLIMRQEKITAVAEEAAAQAAAAAAATSQADEAAAAAPSP